jgi:broad specificity phosphatase PhoE
MHVYFVRHGETSLGKRYVHQSPNTPLSERGREESRTGGEYLRSVNPDLLLSSEYTRALETARIIGQYTGLIPETNGLFYEVVRPSSLFGKTLFSPWTIWYALLSVLRKNNSTFRYEDAENFTDLRDRAKRALAYLESLHETHESVVVVSHKMFIHIMVSYMCEDRLLSIRDLLPVFLHVEQMASGDVVHVEYTGGGEGTCSWRLVSSTMST